MRGVSYYAERAARDPDWHAAQLAGAKERESERRAKDPEAFRAAAREKTRRTRERQRARGLTFQELLDRSRECAGAGPLSLGDPIVLRRILRQEIAAGRIDYHSTSRRYVLNGGLPEDVKQAFRELKL
jgi:hypothetical protein